MLVLNSTLFYQGRHESVYLKVLLDVLRDQLPLSWEGPSPCEFRYGKMQCWQYQMMKISAILLGPPKRMWELSDVKTAAVGSWPSVLWALGWWSVRSSNLARVGEERQKHFSKFVRLADFLCASASSKFGQKQKLGRSWCAVKSIEDNVSIIKILPFLLPALNK